MSTDRDYLRCVTPYRPVGKIPCNHLPEFHDPETGECEIETCFCTSYQAGRDDRYVYTIPFPYWAMMVVAALLVSITVVVIL